MKKNLKVLLFVLGVLVLSACSNIQEPHFQGGVNMDFDSQDEGMLYN